MNMLLLAILDGWGYSENTIGNAIYYAHTPNFDRYFRKYPHTFLEASGEAVGLPKNQMGNSEVGHLNIGAGRIVYQEATKILKAIKTGEFFENEVLKKAMKIAKKRKLHLMGLIGDGGVHAMMEHLYALLEMAKKEGVKDVKIHCFLDGRDTPPKSAIHHIKKLEEKIKEMGIGEIASLIGRYFAMDRDKRWERTKKAYEMLVKGRRRIVKNAEEGIKIAYKNGETDEFVQPTVIEGDNRIGDGDVVIFFNFRPDRARQLTQAFIDENFDIFPKTPVKIHFVSLTRYDEKFNNEVAFEKENLTNTFGEIISKNGLKQLRIAETEKYAHVTYFFSGGKEEPFKGEERCLIPSPKIPTYDLKPEMSAYEVTEEVIERIESGGYDVIILNYANPDMVGHTGSWKATLKAVETVDKCMGDVVKKILEYDGTAMVTSDHGNAEEMFENDGVKTAHTKNPVPFILINKEMKKIKLRKGILGDIAPTMLEILGIEKPPEMKGKSLIF
ncbi:MAG TPA: 2,3-bisphosphoglycerate-independent phosphoglycerate mutase [Thermoplasmatales archaeon]|nr:2,3-bisphosphoglycerate-independent phosphoglycerate mutase [Thermoplasmatales archaeon]